MCFYISHFNRVCGLFLSDRSYPVDLFLLSVKPTVLHLVNQGCIKLKCCVQYVVKLKQSCIVLNTI